MASVADDPSVLEYEDPVEIHHAGQAVGDEQDRLVRHTGFDVLDELVLADGIEGGRRFVEYHDLMILIQRAGQSDFVPLSLGQIGSLGIVLLVQVGFISLFKLTDEFIRSRSL